MGIPRDITKILNNYKKFENFTGYKITSYGKLKDIEDKIELKNKKGAYIILSDKQKFLYPNRTSKICYIGKANNFYIRLNNHRKRFINMKEYLKKNLKYYFEYDKYSYMNSFGANVYIIEKDNEFPENLEYYLLDAFYSYHYAFPVGNNQCPSYREK